MSATCAMYKPVSSPGNIFEPCCGPLSSQYSKPPEPTLAIIISAVPFNMPLTFVRNTLNIFTAVGSVILSTVSFWQPNESITYIEYAVAIKFLNLLSGCQWMPSRENCLEPVPPLACTIIWPLFWPWHPVTFVFSRVIVIAEGVFKVTCLKWSVPQTGDLTQTS